MTNEITRVMVTTKNEFGEESNNWIGFKEFMKQVANYPIMDLAEPFETCAINTATYNCEQGYHDYKQSSVISEVEYCKYCDHMRIKSANTDHIDKEAAYIAKRGRR